MAVLKGEEYPAHGFVFSVVDNAANPGSAPLQVPASQLQSITFTPPASSSSTSGYSSSTSGSASPYASSDNASSYSSSYDEDEDEGGGLGSGGLWMFAGIGLAAILGGLLIFFLANTAVNSLLIWGVCKLGDVAEIRYKQCFYCALYLGILPIILIPLLLIPILGPWLYLVCLAGGARAIVMGSLEVLEGTAWMVMVGFGLSSWLLGRFVKEFLGQIGG